MNTAVDFNPNWASVPGNTIKDILSERQYSVSVFADKMKSTPDFIVQLLNGQEKITAEIAEKLSVNLGASIEFWLKREEIYRSKITEINNDQADMWLRELPVNDMIKFGWIRNVKNKVEECLNYFDVPDISTWRRKYATAFESVSFRTSPSFKSDQGATAVWLRRGEQVAFNKECNEWNEEKFEASLQTIRGLSRKKSPKEFLPELKRICEDCGVILETPFK